MCVCMCVNPLATYNLRQHFWAANVEYAGLSFRFPPLTIHFPINTLASIHMHTHTFSRAQTQLLTRTHIHTHTAGPQRHERLPVCTARCHQSGAALVQKPAALFRLHSETGWYSVTFRLWFYLLPANCSCAAKRSLHVKLKYFWCILFPPHLSALTFFSSVLSTMKQIWLKQER